MKKFLIVYYGDTPVCVEGFKDSVQRSCKGALHINPGRQMTITEDELAHIKVKHAYMLPKLRVLSEMKEEAKKEEPSNSKDAASLKDEAPQSEEHKGKQKHKKK